MSLVTLPLFGSICICLICGCVGAVFGLSIDAIHAKRINKRIRLIYNKTSHLFQKDVLLVEIADDSFQVRVWNAQNGWETVSDHNNIENAIESYNNAINKNRRKEKVILKSNFK